MEGSKNAMYAQAGKSRGWTQGAPDGNAPKTPEKRTQDMLAGSVVSMMPEKAEKPMMPMAPVMPEIAEKPAMPMAAVTPEIAEKPMILTAPVMPEIAENPITPMAATIPENPIMPVIPMMTEEAINYRMPQIPAPPMVIPPDIAAPAKDCQTLAMAYVEMQKWQKLYEPEQGFSRGTIFTELDLPFIGEGACRYE